MQCPPRLARTGNGRCPRGRRGRGQSTSHWRRGVGARTRVRGDTPCTQWTVRRRRLSTLDGRRTRPRRSMCRARARRRPEESPGSERLADCSRRPCGPGRTGTVCRRRSGHCPSSRAGTQPALRSACRARTHRTGRCCHGNSRGRSSRWSIFRRWHSPRHRLRPTSPQSSGKSRSPRGSGRGQSSFAGRRWSRRGPRAAAR